MTSNKFYSMENIIGEIKNLRLIKKNVAFLIFFATIMLIYDN